MDGHIVEISHLIPESEGSFHLIVVCNLCFTSVLALVTPRPWPGAAPGGAAWPHVLGAPRLHHVEVLHPLHRAGPAHRRLRLLALPHGAARVLQLRRIRLGVQVRGAQGLTERGYEISIK